MSASYHDHQDTPYDERSYIAFDLSQIPAGAAITTASLEIHASGDDSPTMTLRRVDEAWDEATLAAPDRPVASVQVATASFVKGVRTAVDVTSVVQDWVAGTANHGLEISSDRSIKHLTWLSTREAASSKRPTLTVSYLPDTQPPTVELTAPLAVLDWGTLILAADTTGAVDRVEFYVDDVLVGTDEAAPYSVSWDSTGVADGLHTVEARAVDGLGRTASAFGDFEIANALTAPQRLRHDLESGAISSEAYVRALLDLVQPDFAVPARYDTEVGEGLTGAFVRAAYEMTNVEEPALSELAGRMEFTPLAEQAQGTSTSQSSPMAASTAVPGTPTFSCDPSQGRVMGYPSDCWAVYGDFTIHYLDAEAGPDDDGDGVPTVVEEVGRGYLEALEAYELLGFSIPFTVNTVITADAPDRAFALPELNLPLGAGGAVPNIVLSPATALPRYTAAHELFHSVQYGFIAGHLDSNIDILFTAGSRRLNTYIWWMEATAEWGAHQWADHVGLATDSLLRDAYHSALNAFLDAPEEWLAGPPLLRPGLPSDQRNYGAFVVAEWLEDVNGADAIRQSWASARPTKAATVAIQEAAVGAGDGEDWLPQMWADIYHLDITTVTTPEMSRWRERLSPGGPPFDVTDRRMATESLTGQGTDGGLTAGSAHSATATVGRGGVKAFEFLPEPGTLVTVDVTGSRPSVHAAAQALADYNSTPSTGPTLCTDVDAVRTSDTSWTLTMITPNQGCEGVVLLVTNTDPGVGLVFNEALDIEVEITLAPLVTALEQELTRTDVDVATFGLGGLRDVGTGAFFVTGVSSPVEKALLVWHGPTNSGRFDANAAITLNGQPVYGAHAGFGYDNNWNYLNSQTYIADVTSIVTGDGDYAVDGFVKDGGNINVNGASLIVLYDDGDTRNDVESYLLYVGNDSTCWSQFDAAGWSANLGSIDPAGGRVHLQVHVSDGQTWLDGDVLLNGTTIAAGPSVFDGTTWGDGTSGTGSLWDIATYDITDLVVAGEDLVLTSPLVQDCLALVSASVTIEPSGSTTPPTAQSQAATATAEPPGDHWGATP